MPVEPKETVLKRLFDDFFDHFLGEKYDPDRVDDKLWSFRDYLRQEFQIDLFKSTPVCLVKETILGLNKRKGDYCLVCDYFMRIPIYCVDRNLRLTAHRNYPSP